MSVNHSTSAREGLDMGMLALRFFFLVMGLGETVPRTGIPLATRYWLGSTQLYCQTRCQEVWHEPDFLKGLSCDGGFGRWTRCSCHVHPSAFSGTLFRHQFLLLWLEIVILLFFWHFLLF